MPELALSRLVPAPGVAAEELLAEARLLLAHSSHPLARPLAADLPGPGLEAVESRPGLGIAARTGAGRLLAGSRRFLEEELPPEPVAARSLLASLAARVLPEETPVFVARSDQVLGVVTFREALRDETPEVVRRLARLGWEVRVLTGDTPERGLALERALGVTVAAALLPHDKVAVLRREAARGRVTVMVGDGVNDAPVLAAAHLGVALAAGADLAREAAEVVINRWEGDRLLGSLPYLVELGRTTVRRIRWNLAWAASYNAAGVTLAAVGWIHPLLAVALMVLSSLTVLRISLAGESPPGGGEPISGRVALRGARGRAPWSPHPLMTGPRAGGGG